MPITVQTNVAAMIAQTHLARAQGKLAKNFERLSSGYRINGAADDAAGLGISKNLEAQVSSFAYAERNANDGISLVQTADGSADEIQDMLSRMRDLAVQGANGTLSAADSANLDVEFQTQIQEIDRTANVSWFNGRSLLAGAASSVTLQIGIHATANDHVVMNLGSVDSAGLGLTGLGVGSNASARAAIATIDAASQSLSARREDFGATINRLTDAVANLESMTMNLTATLSRTRDVDVAAETASLSSHEVLSQASAAVLSQANQAPQIALKLLGV